MRIMVFDVPAESGGALTILNQYYQSAVIDSQNHYVFVVSCSHLENQDNIEVVTYPWIKRSWFHRLYFDLFVANKLVKWHRIDEVLSLQNITIPLVKVRQIVYLHQSLPFVSYRYALKENKKLWFYQNIMGMFIVMSIKKADQIIVQTEWMQKACLKKANINSNNILIKSPVQDIEVKKVYTDTMGTNKMFFYPAGANDYKNHRIILEAIHKIKLSGLDNYIVIFTLTGEENTYAKELYETSLKLGLNVDFIGKQSIEDVYEFYSKSILIFPSYIETVGLPLIEARKHNTPILASDCEFSHEVLEDYKNVDFFNPFESEELKRLILKYLH